MTRRQYYQRGRSSATMAASPWRARRLIFVHLSDKAHCFGDKI